MKIGRPLLFTSVYYTDIEKEIERFFKREIFNPLARNFTDGTEELMNSADPLLTAVRDGEIYYYDGAFRGSFSSKTSSRLRAIGARYLVRDSSWEINRANIPAELLTAQAIADDRFRRLKDGLVKSLNALDIEQQFEKYGFTEKYERALELMDDRFADTVQGITIAPKMTPEMKQRIADEWSNNLKLYVKDWTAQSILDLRQEVQQNAFAGLRAENMVKIIQGRYDVSKRKAKFLARQETSLLMSKFRETRYKDVGVEEYLWSGRDDGRERPMHIRLNNTRHRFDNPPVTNEDGDRNNPGEDYNCRCTARPIFKGY